MNYVHILVEGQTEETFVRDVLTPYLSSRNVRPIAKLLVTKRIKSGSTFKGGVSTYGKIKQDLCRLLPDRNVRLVTTMLDYYRLPHDFPGYGSRPTGTCFQRVKYLEQAFKDDIGSYRFVPYLALHEFEAMMFVQPEKIAENFPGTNVLKELQAIRNAFTSPEEINEKTPPSKRLLKIFPTYQKLFHGPLVVDEIGIGQIKEQCGHFAAWLNALEEVGSRE